MDLVSLLPALETQEWLLFIWPKWSHYPSVRESGNWLTVMFPPCSFAAICIDSAMLSNEQDYFWPCDGIFIKVSVLWPVFRVEIAHMEMFLSCFPRWELEHQLPQVCTYQCMQPGKQTGGTGASCLVRRVWYRRSNLHMVGQVAWVKDCDR